MPVLTIPPRYTAPRCGAASEMYVCSTGLHGGVMHGRVMHPSATAWRVVDEVREAQGARSPRNKTPTIIKIIIKRKHRAKRCFQKTCGNPLGARTNPNHCCCRWNQRRGLLCWRRILSGLPWRSHHHTGLGGHPQVRPERGCPARAGTGPWGVSVRCLGVGVGVGMREREKERARTRGGRGGEGEEWE